MSKEIALCLNHDGYYTSELTSLFSGLISPPDYEFIHIFPSSPSINNWNMMLEKTLERESIEWIFLMSADQIIEPDIPRKMIEKAEKEYYWCETCDRIAQLDNIPRCGRCNRRIFPKCEKCNEYMEPLNIKVLRPLTFNYQNELPVFSASFENLSPLENSSLARTKEVSLDCLLIKKDILKRLARPFFSEQFDRNSKEVKDKQDFFQHKLERAEIPIFIDTSLRVGKNEKISLKQLSSAFSTSLESQSFEEFQERF